MAVVTSLGFSLYSTWNGRGARKAARDIDVVAATMAATERRFANMHGPMGRFLRGLDTVAGGMGAVSLALVGLESTSAAFRANLGLIELGLIGLGATAVTAASTVGLALAALPLAFLGAGAALAIMSGELNETLGWVGNEFSIAFRKGVAPMVPIMQDFFEKTASFAYVLGETLQKVFTSIGSSFTVFLDSLIGFFSILVAGLGDVAIKAAPTLEALGGGLVILARGLVNFFDKLATVAPQAAVGVTALFTGTSNLLNLAADILVVLTKVGVHALPFMSQVMGIIGAIIRSVLLPAFMALIPAFDALAKSGLGTALMKIVQALGPLVSVVVGIIAQLVANYAPVAALLAGALGNILTVAVQALVPVLNVLSSILKALGPNGTMAAIAMFLLGKMLLGFVVASAAQAGLSISKLTALQMLLSGSARKAMAAQMKAFLATKLGWMKASAHAMAHAIKIAAAWFIALGPIGMIIAAVLAIVAVFVLFREKAVAVVKVVWNWIVNVAKAVWNWFTNLKTGFKILVGIAAIVLAPVTIIIALIVLLVKNWDKVKAAAIRAWNAIKAGAVAVWNFLKAAFQPVVDAMRAGWEKLSSAVKQAWQAIWTAIKPIVDKIKAAWNAMFGSGGKVKSLMAPVINWLKSAFSAVGRAISAVFRFLQPAFEVFGRVAVAVFRVIVRFIKEYVIIYFKVLAAIIKVVFQVIVTIIKVAVAIIVGVIKAIIVVVKVIVAIVTVAVKVIIAIIKVIIAGVKFWVNAIKVAWNGLVTAWHAVWNAIKAVVNWVKTQIIDKIVAFIRFLVVSAKIQWEMFKHAVIVAFNAVRSFLISVWNGIKSFLSAVWNGIKAAGSAVWNAIKTVITAVWTSIKTTATNVWNAIKSFLSGLWNGIKSVATSVFNAVKKVITGVWNAIKTSVTTVWNAIKGFLTGLWDGLRNRVSIIWNAIKAKIAAVWSAIVSNVKSVWNSIKSFVYGIWDGFKNRVKAVWDFIWGKVKDVWNNIKTLTSTAFNAVKTKIVDIMDAVKSKIKTVVDSVKGFWEGLKDTTETVFKKIKEFVRVPIAFVVKTVYNDGIVKVWNFISDKLFGGKGQLDEVDEFAKGGRVWGRGTSTSDSVNAKLSRNEHVWTAREVAGAGGHGAVARLRSQARGGKPVSMGPGNGTYAFAGGGFVDWIKEQASSQKTLGGTVDSGVAGDLVVKVIENLEALMKLPGRIKNLLKGLAEKFNGDIAPFKDMMMAGLDKAKDKFLEHLEALIALGGTGGHPGDYKAMEAWIKSVVPETAVTSGYRPGDPGYHGKKLAIDMAWPDRSETRGGGLAETAYNAIKAAWTPSIAELIWDFSPDGPSKGIWNGKPHTFGGATSGPGTHADHIHWASSNNPMSGLSGLVGVMRWAGVVNSALGALGMASKGNEAAVLEAIRQESGGNPNIVNNWDSNAAAGTPSKGLMQVIQPTFDAYAGPFKKMGIMNPFANIYAAVNYARSRYGGNWQEKITAPGGYAFGGAVASYDQGGMLQPGWTMAYNGTGRPEPVGHDLIEGGKGDIHFHFHGPVSDRQTIEDWTVRAMKDAKKKGRL